MQLLYNVIHPAMHQEPLRSSSTFSARFIASTTALTSIKYKKYIITMVKPVWLYFQEFSASFQKYLEVVQHMKANRPAHMPTRKGPAKWVPVIRIKIFCHVKVSFGWLRSPISRSFPLVVEVRMYRSRLKKWTSSRPRRKRKMSRSPARALSERWRLSLYQSLRASLRKYWTSMQQQSRMSNGV